MKFGTPLLTTELSGALGGVVGANARGGVSYFRARIRPGNPRSPAQTVTRAVLTGLAAAWTSVLTGVQRAAWEAISPAESSGIDTFIKGNMQQRLAGEDYAADAPVSVSLASSPLATAVVVDASAHTIVISIPDTADTSISVYISKGQSPSRLARQFGYTYVDNSDLDGNTGTNTVNIPVSHPAYNLTAGDVVYVRIVPFGDTNDPFEGQVGGAQELRIVVAA
jgi:hypothetical protein